MHHMLSSRLQILVATLALTSVGLSAWASSALVKPANVGARTSDGAATLSWDAVAGATGYQYRQRKSEDDTYSAWRPTTSGTAATHTVRPLYNGATYSFQVRAVRGAGNGPASDAVTATLLTVPADLTATPGDGQVALSWQAVAGATGYQHRKRKPHDVDYEAWTAMATSTSHTVTPLHNGTTYSFQVRAVRGADLGPASAGAATPFAPCGGESSNADLAGDCEALLVAKAALDPGGSLNWARSRALGEWRGVKVSAGRVTQMSCPAGGLAGGRLADSLGRLTGLTHIWLGECGLTGDIPSSLASLRNLEVLHAYNNNLSGGIPDLGRLSKLRELSLSGNKLNGNIPAWLGSLVNLEHLYLDRNDLRGSLPALGGLVKLKGLGLGDLDLDAGPIPAWVGHLVDLERLNFRNSNRTGAVPPLGRLTKLWIVQLENNALTDISALAPLVNLEVLLAYDNNLSGAIPDLGLLSKLRDLSLSGNKLTGAVPPWLGSLVNLEHLSLDRNDLDGGLPALGGLVKLRRLSLGNLDLDAGPIPAWVGRLVDLEHLDFGNSNRTGAVPPLGRLTKLRIAWLGGNALTDISALAPLVNLEALHAYDNNLSGAIPNLGRTSKLRQLFLSGNKLSGVVPPWLGSLVNLEGLGLGGNELDGGLPALGGLVKLKSLDLGGLDLDAGPIPAWVGNLVDLEHLDFRNSNRTGTVPPLGRLTQLRFVRLENNALTDISALAPLVNLEVLLAYDNNLSGTIPNLGRLSKLRDLSLSSNKLTGNVPPWLGSLVNLEHLSLDRNDLDGGLPALGGLVKLRRLSLGNLDLDAGPIPAWVGNLVDLEHLDFGNSNRTGAVPPLGRLTQLRLAWLGGNALTDISALAPLANLEVLHAYGNNLSGAIPNLGRLSKLRDLSLSGNKLRGNVPAWLGSLVNLEQLHLDRNGLRGGLPALGNLVKLKGLYLQNNLLAGTIPATLGNLPELTVLRLNGNQLEGCIPTKLASHTSTINPQKNGANLAACAASGAAPLASNAIVPAVAVTARDERATRRGLSRIVPRTPSPRRRDDNSPARQQLWSTPSEADFGTFHPEAPNPMPDLHLAPSGERAAVALSCFFPVDWLGARPYAAYAATSTATELATAAAVGDLLIITPNQRGLEGELAVVVTRLGQQGGASARLRVVVRSHAPPDNARWRVSGAACATASPGREPRVRFPG